MPIININLSGYDVTVDDNSYLANVSEIKAVSTDSYSDAYTVNISSMGYDSNVITGTFDVLLMTSLTDLFDAIDSYALTVNKSVADTVLRSEQLSKSFVKIIVTSVQTSDTLLQNEIEGLLTTSTTAEQLRRNVAKVLVEQPATYEAFVKAASKSLIDLSAVTDQLSRSVAKVRSDQASHSELVTIRPGKSTIEPIAVTDAVTKQLAAVRQETPFALEQVAKRVDSVLLQPAVAIDSLVSNLNKILSSNAGASDYFTKIETKGLVEALMSSDSLNLNAVKDVQDYVTAIVELAFSLQKSLSDAYTASDSVAVKAFTKVVQSTSVTSDTLQFTAIFNRSYQDTHNATDSIAKALSRVLSDSVTVSVAEPFINLSQAYLPQQLDNTSLSEYLTANITKILVETGAVTEQVSKTLSSNLIDTVNALSSIRTDLYHFESATSTDTNSVFDAVTLQMLRAVLETVSTSEYKFFDIGKNPVSTIPTSEHFSLSGSKPLQDTYVATEAVLKYTSKPFTETLSVASVYENDISKPFAETKNVTDSGGVYTNNYCLQDYVEPTYNATLRSSF